MFHVNQKCSEALRTANTVHNLVSFGQTGQLELEHTTKERDRENFKEAVNEIRAKLRRMGRTTISPQSKFLRYWDLICVICMAWTALVTPFEVGFLPATFEASSMNFIMCASTRERVHMHMRPSPYAHVPTCTR